MAKKPLSARTLRRVGERDQEKLARDRERLFALEPGGTAARPLIVESASVIEPTARAVRCPRCVGELRVEEHAARIVGGVSLRAVRLRCAQCGVPRELWFRITLALPS
jgi:hypothetical protein